MSIQGSAQCLVRMGIISMPRIAKCRLQRKLSQFVVVTFLLIVFITIISSMKWPQISPSFPKEYRTKKKAEIKFSDNLTTSE